MKNAISQGGLPAELVGHVAKGVQNQLRRMDFVEASKVLGLLIPKVAKAYGNRSDLDEFTVKQCIDIALDDYGHLGVEEIPVAYRLWASGTIKALEMWGGQFNGAQFGRVLAAYDEHRKEIWAALEKAKRAEEEEQLAEERAAQAEEYRRKFPQYLRDYVGRNADRLTGWQDMQIHWYSLAKANQMLGMDMADVERIWQTAQDYAKAEKFAQLQDANPIAALDIRRNLEDKVASRARVIAQKLSVWERVVGPMIQELKNAE